jgi:hypothetical protein
MPCENRGRSGREGWASGIPDCDPSATSDLEALRSVFDTNGDGRQTNADSTWPKFKAMVGKNPRGD